MLLIRSIPPLLILLAAGCGGEEPPERPNVILVSIDTLRADHLGCYGYARDTSPFMDALAERDDTVRFARCTAQASTTAPSHMSFLTSLHPVVHGVPNIPPHKGVARMYLPVHTRTLAEVLRG